jgi:hypothetical protein
LALLIINLYHSVGIKKMRDIIVTLETKDIPVKSAPRFISIRHFIMGVFFLASLFGATGCIWFFYIIPLEEEKLALRILIDNGSAQIAALKNRSVETEVQLEQFQKRFKNLDLRIDGLQLKLESAAVAQPVQYEKKSNWIKEISNAIHAGLPLDGFLTLEDIPAAVRAQLTALGSVPTYSQIMQEWTGINVLLHLNKKKLREGSWIEQLKQWVLSLVQIQDQKEVDKQLLVLKVEEALEAREFDKVITSGIRLMAIVDSPIQEKIKMWMSRVQKFQEGQMLIRRVEE